MTARSAVAEQNSPAIEISETSLIIHDLSVPKRDVADYLRSVPEKERAGAIIHAIEVGVFCLERARTAQDTEFIRRQIDSLLHNVEQVTNTIPGAIQEQLISRIGTADGQVLAPVRQVVDEAKRSIIERVQEVRVLAEQIDPERDGSKLGKVLRTVTDLLDPRRRDSVQGALAEAVRSVAQHDGALAATVKTVVEGAMKPLADEVNRLAKQIQADQSVKDALDQTIAKGSSYEDEVVQLLQAWGRGAGVEVHHVGGDNQPGDIVIISRDTSVSGVEMSITVEAKDRSSPAGRRRIADDLSKTIAHRKTGAAIYVSRTRSGLADEVGEWAEGVCDGGPYVVTVHEHLITAAWYILVKQRLVAERSSLPMPNVDVVEQQLGRIRVAMERVVEINRKVTNAKAALDGIRTEAEAIRCDVRDALLRSEDALRTVARTEGQR
jgi:hypothetical protein